TGLGLTLAELGRNEEAATALRKGIAQNGDAEPLLYQLLGSELERLDRRKEAVAAYERFLALAPEHALAPAVRSIVERLQNDQTRGTAEDDADVNPYA